MWKWGVLFLGLAARSVPFRAPSSFSRFCFWPVAEYEVHIGLHLHRVPGRDEATTQLLTPVKVRPRTLKVSTPAPGSVSRVGGGRSSGEPGRLTVCSFRRGTKPPEGTGTGAHGDIRAEGTSRRLAWSPRPPTAFIPRWGPANNTGTHIPTWRLHRPFFPHPTPPTEQGGPVLRWENMVLHHRASELVKGALPPLIQHAANAFRNRIRRPSYPVSEGGGHTVRGVGR